MTRRQAEATANLVIAATAAGAAFYVLRTPPLRRGAWGLMRWWAAGPLAAWAATELRRAWDASGSAAPSAPEPAGAARPVGVGLA